MPLLIVTGDCRSCRDAERVWRAACAAMGVVLECVDAESTRGAALVAEHALKSLPVLILDGKVAVAGVPSTDLACRILNGGTS